MRKFNSSAIKDTDIAWAAGFFDGEGSTVCCINNGRPFTRIQMTLGQKDYKEKIALTLIKFHNIVKVGNIYQKRRKGKEINMHQFYVCKLKDVIKCAKLLWSYLSKNKKEQFIKCSNKFKKATKKEIII